MSLSNDSLNPVPLLLGGSAGISREAFVREDLERWGLCGPLGESAPDARWRAFGGVAARRRLVGEYLGVGDCDAKQLLRQMNLFFSTDEARRMRLVPISLTRSPFNSPNQSMESGSLAVT